jgi:hypothetical protein
MLLFWATNISYHLLISGYAPISGHTPLSGYVPIFVYAAISEHTLNFGLWPPMMDWRSFFRLEELPSRAQRCPRLSFHVAGLPGPSRGPGVLQSLPLCDLLPLSIGLSACFPIVCESCPIPPKWLPATWGLRPTACTTLVEDLSEMLEPGRSLAQR